MLHHVAANCATFQTHAKRVGFPYAPLLLLFRKKSWPASAARLQARSLNAFLPTNFLRLTHIQAISIL